MIRRESLAPSAFEFFSSLTKIGVRVASFQGAVAQPEQGIVDLAADPNQQWFLWSGELGRCSGRRPIPSIPYAESHTHDRRGRGWRWVRDETRLPSRRAGWL